MIDSPMCNSPVHHPAGPCRTIFVGISGGCASVHNVHDLRTLSTALRGCKLHLIFISFYSIVYIAYTRNLYF